MDLGTLLQGAGDIYKGYTAQQGYNNMTNTLQNMYGPNSPYAQQLRQQLDRRDAAAGRRSQYGPREVELQANLAGQYSKNAPALLQGLNQGNANRNMFMNGGMQLLKQSGLLDKLKGVLGGNGLSNQWDLGPNAGPQLDNGLGSIFGSAMGAAYDPFSLMGGSGGLGDIFSAGSGLLGGSDPLGGLGSLFGGGSGGNIGGTIGSVAGNYFGGPVGETVGNFLGNTLGSLF